jgi:hypothetical protein
MTLTLSALAAQSSKLYLDNSVMDKDYNWAKCPPWVKSRPSNVDFGKRLGKPQHFRELNFNLLRRQVGHSVDLWDIIVSYPSVLQSAESLADYKVLVTHIGAVLEYLQKKSPGRPGKKQTMLEMIQRNHTSIYQELCQRLEPSEDNLFIQKIMSEQEMYNSFDYHYQIKRNVGRAVGKATIATAAQAMCSAMNSADQVNILSVNMGTINLIRNYVLAHQNEDLPPTHLARPIQAQIAVYFPCVHNWIPNHCVLPKYITNQDDIEEKQVESLLAVNSK